MSVITVPSITATGLLWSLLGLFISRFFYRYYTNPLRKYPGPFIASLTELWGVYVAKRHYHDPTYQVKIHGRYGKIVRVGPNVLSFSQPEAIKDIYAARFPKSEAYETAAAVSNGQIVTGIFSTTDQNYHSRLRRAVNSAFTMTSTVSYEPFTSKIINEFLDKVDDKFASKKGPSGILDLPKWMAYFATDAIGELTNGESYGMIDAGLDTTGIFEATQTFQEQRKFTFPMPVLDRIFFKNPIQLWIGRHGWGAKPSPTVPFAIRNLQKHEQINEKLVRDDLLTRFIQAKRENDFMTEKDVLAMSLSVVNAGADTTAITLAAIFYYLVKNPRCLARLEQEITTQLPPPHHKSFKVLPSFTQTQKLPYLDAVINETFRIHPAFGALQYRKVPAGGANVCGEYIPGGTVVGCNSWVLHRDVETFGEDVDVFRPGRWLEDAEKTTKMHRAMFHFGGGAHTCIGKNISVLEIYKLVASFIGTFKMKPVNPSQECIMSNRIFVGMTNFDIQIERRHKVTDIDS